LATHFHDINPFFFEGRCPTTSSLVSILLGRLTNLTRTIPVLKVYATAVTKKDGQVFFFPDIYGHDCALARLEAQPYGSQD